LGDLAYVATDVADESLLAAAVSAAEHRWGRPLDGVFHLAGGYASRPLLQETAATMEKTIHTKVHGAWTLDRILADRPAATMVTFASVLGYFGGVQDGAYAASNAYLEGLAYQQRRAGRRGTCLMWGPWFETGMNRGSGFEAATRGKGYPPLQPQDGMRLLWQVLEQDRPHLLIGHEPSNVHVRSHLVSSAAAEVEPTAADFVAPRTETQQQLARIWQEVLGVPRVGLHDNFFELGGDSLQAACVFARIEAVLRRDLPIASLFRAPTVESLAALVEGASEWMPIRVVALRAIGAQVPLFCFPGGGEDAIVFRALAGLLHDDRPVYSLQCSGLDASECLEPVASIEAIASGFIRAMRVTQLRGPYFLAGHCLGGLLAFEVAQQLVAGGETVGLLGLVDTIVSDSFPTDLRAPFRDRVMHRLRCLAAWSPHKGWTDGQAQSLRGREAARARRRRRKSWEQLEAMHGAYVLRPYSGRLTLFLAADSFLNRAPERDPRLAWKQFAAGGCDVVHVAGDHESLLHAPFVGDLANQIEDRMRCIESKTDATVARVYSPCAAPASNTRPRS
jgi:thioesterase domain-containing protein/NAD(P)-dependent dehydrogenase (short-subunit alcohol dehydrogenase family)